MHAANRVHCICELHVVVFDRYTRNLKPYFVHEDSLFMELQAACSCIACMIVIWYRFDSPLFPVFLCGGGTIRKAKVVWTRESTDYITIYGSLATRNQLVAKGPQN